VLDHFEAKLWEWNY